MVVTAAMCTTAAFSSTAAAKFTVGGSFTLGDSAPDPSDYGYVNNYGTSTMTVTGDFIIYGDGGSYVDNGGSASESPTLSVGGSLSLGQNSVIDDYGTIDPPAITVMNGSTLVVEAGATLEVQSLTVESGGEVDVFGTLQAPSAAALSGNIVTETGGQIEFQTTTPAVTSAAFVYDSGAPQRVTMSFNQDVGSNLVSSSFSVTGPSGSVPYTRSYNNITDTVTLSFSGILTDDNYTAQANAQFIKNGQGTAMSSNFSLSFFFLTADANQDRVVNSADFMALASNFNTSSNASFSEGDFNYDGRVNALDFNILATNFGRTLSPSASVSSTVAPPKPLPPVEATAQNPAPLFNQPILRSHDPLDLLLPADARVL